jgi:CheY-like chemotaxis protein
MTGPDSSPFRVLVVENDESLRELLAEMLACCGCRADVARDGEEALDAALREDYDLILSDVRLPRCDGPTFYRALRMHAPERAERVAFMTGADPGASPLREFLERWRCPLLRKPVTRRDLDGFVREVLPVGA